MPSTDYQEFLINTLKDPFEAAAYLNACLEDGDSALILNALSNIIEANGGNISSLSESSGSYQAIREEGNPRFSTLKTVLDGLGFRLTIQPKVIKPASQAYLSDSPST